MDINLPDEIEVTVKVPTDEIRRAVANMRSSDHPKRLATLKRFCRWYFGDSSWAERVIAAYWNPDETNARLDEQGCSP